MLSQKVASLLSIKLSGVKGKSGNFGHAGRPGLRGGSASKSVPSPPITSEEASNRLKSYIWGDIDSKLDDAQNHKKVSGLKNKIVTALSQATGVPYQKVNRIIRSWADTSNESELARLIQSVAQEEFGVALSQWQKSLPEVSLNAFDNARGITKEDVRKVVKTMYANTQAELKALGITEVKLYRGLVTQGRPASKPGQEYAIDSNAVESWSLSKGVAQTFAVPFSGMSATVLSTTVPVSRILCTPRTGFGCLNEEEVLVLGDGEEGGDRAKAEWTQHYSEWLKEIFEKSKV